MSAASSVVLPAPFGPITETIVPRFTLSEMFRTASTLPYETQSSPTSSSVPPESAALIGVPPHPPEWAHFASWGGPAALMPLRQDRLRVPPDCAEYRPAILPRA